MRSIGSSFLILFGLLLCFDCSDGFDTGTRHPSEQVHDYQDEDNHKKDEDSHSRLQNKYQDTNFGETGDGSSRWIWQKPNLIIKQLQPLDGKIIADIGAGPYGYFALRIAYQAQVAKVIATDIDQGAIKFMEDAKQLLPIEVRQRFETRLVEPNDPKLKPQEVDIALVVNTASYFEDRVDYFKRLKTGISPGGKLVIVEFKKRNTPVGPDINERVSLGDIEKDLHSAGYKHIIADDRTLDYQYIVTAIIE